NNAYAVEMSDDDGAIYVAGAYGGSQFAITKFSTDGTADASWPPGAGGGGGTKTISFSGTTSDIPSSIELFGVDGVPYMLVAGSGIDNTTHAHTWLVARLNMDGVVMWTKSGFQDGWLNAMEFYADTARLLLVGRDNGSNMI